MFQANLNTNIRNNKEKTSSQRNNRRYLEGVLFLLSVLLIIFISCWMVLRWIKYTQHLSLSKLVIVGEQHYTHNDDIYQLILTLSSLNKFMTKNVNVIQNQIKQLPWIKQVSVRKQWPDKLKIYLVEYVPIARWNDQYMVDIDGNSFSIPIDRSNQQNLPNLYGPKGSNNEVLQGFRKMEQMLVKSQFMLKDVVVTDCHSWQLTLTNGIKLNLGRNDIMKRISRFLELYPILQQRAQIDGKRIGYVDLRYDSGAAVGWEVFPVKKSNK